MFRYEFAQDVCLVLDAVFASTECDCRVKTERHCYLHLKHGKMFDYRL